MHVGSSSRSSRSSARARADRPCRLILTGMQDQERMHSMALNCSCWNLQTLAQATSDATEVPGCLAAGEYGSKLGKQRVAPLVLSYSCQSQ